MFWICSHILVWGNLASASAVPKVNAVATRQYEQSLKLKSWKPLSNRHHEWLFPQYIECGKKDAYGQSGYNADTLIKGTGAAFYKLSIPSEPQLCDQKVECYRSVFYPYSDKAISQVLEFKVQDDVDHVGQRIQFDLLYVVSRSGRFYCSSPKNNPMWWRIKMGDHSHEDNRDPIKAPPEMS